MLLFFFILLTFLEVSFLGAIVRERETQVGTISGQLISGAPLFAHHQAGPLQRDYSREAAATAKKAVPARTTD